VIDISLFWLYNSSIQLGERNETNTDTQDKSSLRVVLQGYTIQAKEGREQIAVQTSTKA
jgi:hypothetical protein